MNLKIIFKRFVLIDLAIVILLIISIFFQSEIVTTFNETINPENNMSDMLAILAIIYLIAWLVSLYLLYKFKPIGKQIYLFERLLLLTTQKRLPPTEKFV